MWGYLCCFVFVSSSLLSQTILLEDFNHPAGDALTSHGWSAHGSAGTNTVTIVSPGLTYAGHPGSGAGNAARLYSTGEDVGRPISNLSDTDVYVSFLVFIQDATTSLAEHFLHLNTATHVGRVYVRRESGKIAFGVAKATEASSFTESVYSLNTVYLIVLRYTHQTGSDNDAVRLFVFESGTPSSEPTGATLGPVTSAGSEPSGITAIALRQGGSTVSDIIVDGLRVGTSWDEAGLPVTFSGFTATVRGRGIELWWRTESETGNYGFEIERREMSREYGVGSREKEGGRVGGNEGVTNQRQDETTNQRQNEPTNQRNHSPSTVHHSPWSTIGFVPGSGTSSSPRDYSFVDKLNQPGRYAYRIKQIDNGGTFTYTSALEVIIGSFPLESTFAQNFPNPFNPSTTIRFFLQKEGRASICVYDGAGRMVRVLADAFMGSGWHEIVFDAGGLASGTYILRFEVGGQAFVRKVALVK
ncbi:MAG: T9SS type A sorting domain-containing protein [Bacteroidota bacterium]